MEIARRAAPATSECYDGVPSAGGATGPASSVEEGACSGGQTEYHLPFCAIMPAENAEPRFTDVYLSDFTDD